MPSTLSHFLENPWLALALGLAFVMAVLTINALALVWAERKVSAWIQRRMGPMEVGPHGLLQTVADMIKLVSKQLIVPAHIDKPIYFLAPLVVFVPVVASVSLFPFEKHLVLQSLDIGLVWVFALASIGVVGIFMAGWGSNNKYALLGAMRSVAQNISYEIPLILTALSVVLLASNLHHSWEIDGQLVQVNGMNLAHIAALQHHEFIWFIVLQPVAALIYFIASVAETNRAPFDIPEAESELVAGFHTEYSGMRFALFFFAEYSNMFIAGMVFTVLFLGGWSGPGSEILGPIWFFLKTYAIVVAMMWVRWTYPRVRFDQLMRFCWKVLIPLAILNLLVTAFFLKAL